MCILHVLYIVSNINMLKELFRLPQLSQLPQLSSYLAYRVISVFVELKVRNLGAMKLSEYLFFQKLERWIEESCRMKIKPIEFCFNNRGSRSITKIVKFINRNRKVTCILLKNSKEYGRKKITRRVLRANGENKLFCELF